MIRSRNIHPDAEFILAPVVMPVVVFQQTVNGPVVEAIMPYAGKIVTARFRTSQNYLDADNSVRVKVQRNSTDLMVAVDPGPLNATTTFVLNDVTFAKDDILKVHLLAAATDTIVGTMTFTVRPLVGGVERQNLAG